MVFIHETNGFNGARRIFEDGISIDEEIESQRVTLPPPVFHTAVVVDVFNDPEKADPSTIKMLKEESPSPELVDRMPRDSIIGRVITRNSDLIDSSPRIFFPANAYDPEPVKPGESVWVFFPDMIVNDQIGYWWKRVPQPLDAEDLNFTHGDRKFSFNDGISTSERFMGEIEGPPGFDNGGETSVQRTLANPNDFKNINRDAKANLQIIKEPVARFVKRPGDKVIQGSNSSRIVLGMDRAAPVPTPASSPPRKKSSTIDMVVGYGRSGTPTSPLEITNTRSEQEVNKVPKKSNLSSNPIEGDPDIENDKSRLYISEDTNVDINFSSFSAIAGVPPSPGNAGAISGRSDRIRFDAREDIKLKAGQTAIVVDNSGNVKVVTPGASQIALGSSNPLLGVARLNDQTTIDGSTDPAFIGFMSQIFTFMTAVGNAFKGLGVTGLAPQDLGIPSPPTTVMGRISQASQKVKSE